MSRTASEGLTLRFSRSCPPASDRTLVLTASAGAALWEAQEGASKDYGQPHSGILKQKV